MLRLQQKQKKRNFEKSFAHNFFSNYKYCEKSRVWGKRREESSSYKVPDL